jgi:hypothetical protein
MEVSISECNITALPLNIGLRIVRVNTGGEASACDVWNREAEVVFECLHSEWTTICTVDRRPWRLTQPNQSSDDLDTKERMVSETITVLGCAPGFDRRSVACDGQLKGGDAVRVGGHQRSTAASSSGARISETGRKMPFLIRRQQSRVRPTQQDIHGRLGIVICGPDAHTALR